MANVQVRCTVSNCHYWDEGNLCGADKILITSQEVSAKFPQSVDVPEISMVLEKVGETPTEFAEETSCKTFRPKER